jgi:hypothetical protein
VSKKERVGAFLKKFLIFRKKAKKKRFGFGKLKIVCTFAVPNGYYVRLLLVFATCIYESTAQKSAFKRLFCIEDYELKQCCGSVPSGFTFLLRHTVKKFKIGHFVWV